MLPAGLNTRAAGHILQPAGLGGRPRGVPERVLNDLRISSAIRGQPRRLPDFPGRVRGVLGGSSGDSRDTLGTSPGPLKAVLFTHSNARRPETGSPCPIMWPCQYSAIFPAYNYKTGEFGTFWFQKGPFSTPPEVDLRSLHLCSTRSAFREPSRGASQRGWVCVERRPEGPVWRFGTPARPTQWKIKEKLIY